MVISCNVIKVLKTKLRSKQAKINLQKQHYGSESSSFTLLRLPLTQGGQDQGPALPPGLPDPDSVSSL